MSDYIPKFEDTEEVEESEYIPAFDDTEEIVQEEPGMMDYLAETGEGFARGAAQGLTFGFADEITAGLESALTDKTYDQAVKESRAAYELAEEESPVASLLGNIGGGLATMVVPGLGLVNAAKGAKLGELVLKGAVGGGIAGAGISEEKDLSGVAGDAAQGAMFGAAIPLGGKLLAPVGGLVKKGVGELADMIGLTNYPKGLAKKIALPDVDVTGKGAMQEAITTTRQLRNEIIDFNRKYNFALDKMKKNLLEAMDELGITFSKDTHIDTVQDMIREVNRPGVDQKFLKEAQDLLAFENKFFEDLGGRYGLDPDQIKMAMSQIDDDLAQGLAKQDIGYQSGVQSKIDSVAQTEVKAKELQQGIENKLSRYKIAMSKMDDDIAKIDRQMSDLPEMTNKEMIGKNVIDQGQLNKQMNTKYEMLEQKKRQLIAKKNLMKSQHDLELGKLQKTYDETSDELSKDSLDEYMQELVNETDYAKTQLRDQAQKAKQNIQDQSYVPPRGATASEMETARKTMASKAKLDSTGQPLTETGKNMFRDWGKAFYTDQLNRTDQFDEATKNFLKTKSLGGLEEQELALFQEGMLLPQVNELRHKTIKKLKALGLDKIDLTDHNAGALNAIEKKVDQMVGTVYKEVPGVGDIKKTQDLDSLLDLLKQTAPEGKAGDISDRIKDLSERIQLAKQTTKTGDFTQTSLTNLPGWFTRFGAATGEVVNTAKRSASDISNAVKQASPEELQELGAMVMQIGTPVAKKLGETISQGLAGADKNKKTAIMFGLMQRPEYRQILEGGQED